MLCRGLYLRRCLCGTCVEPVWDWGVITWGGVSNGNVAIREFFFSLVQHVNFVWFNDGRWVMGWYVFFTSFMVNELQVGGKCVAHGWGISYVYCIWWWWGQFRIGCNMMAIVMQGSIVECLEGLTQWCGYLGVCWLTIVGASNHCGLGAWLWYFGVFFGSNPSPMCGF